MGVDSSLVLCQLGLFPSKVEHRIFEDYMNLTEITPLVLTYNEKENIVRTLDQLSWARRVVVVDSYSTDATPAIARNFKNVEVFQRTFDNHESQWNFGLDCVETPWVLSLDADYILTESLIDELASLQPGEDVNGYKIGFKYCVFGKPLSGTVLPPRTALFKTAKARYINDGHTQLLSVRGGVETLKSKILHDDRKSLSRWLSAQDKYMILEVKKLFSPVPLSFSDKLRKAIFFAPLVMFFYCLIIKRGFLDGKRGWFYAYQRLLAECLLSIRIIEFMVRRRSE